MDAQVTPGVGDYNINAITSKYSRATYGKILPEAATFKAESTPGVGDYEVTATTSRN